MMQIDSDKKHEELIAKWKKQLEVKARAFESLQKKFAPPRDLEQLRIKIQEEMEGPYQQRINSLQDEVERHRQISFDMRREFEALKTEYEQYSINQSNEMECIHDTYEVTLNDLRRKLQLAEDAAANSQHTENIRRLEQQREAAQIEIKALRDEVRVRLHVDRMKDRNTVSTEAGLLIPCRTYGRSFSEFPNIVRTTKTPMSCGWLMRPHAMLHLSLT